MKSSVKIGRDNTNDIEINEPRISRNHAIITDLGNGTYEIKDLGSTNGTFVNGERITQKIILPDDKVEVATCLVNWYPVFSEPDSSRQISSINEEPFSSIRKTISIGTDKENDMVLSETFVSNFHAELSRLKNGDYYIRDLTSSNGTFVNGARIMAKNFTKTDVVKIATVDLPLNWFLHKKLQQNRYRDHKKTWLISITLLVLTAFSVLSYFNSCNWFNYGCNLSTQQIYLKNKNCLVHIVHEYYYKIDFQGKTYYVGKNSLFKITEANPGKENLLPYNSVSGNGCFIKTDGSILTSAFIVNPWLNDYERNTMIREVLKSKTIKNFALDRDYQICGESKDLKWLANGMVNNVQNYVAATSDISCQLNDSSSVVIRSVKKELPKNAQIVDFPLNSNQQLNPASPVYYSTEKLLNPNSVLLDTFYVSTESVDINKPDLQSITKTLPKLPEGSIVLNERGELLGHIQQQKLILVQHYYKQIKN
jgi:pSer/pThr/pTyr-binding forkhead associated (FHA) protein